MVVQPPAPIRGNSFHGSRRALRKSLPAVLRRRGKVSGAPHYHLVPVDAVDSRAEAVVAVEVLLLRVGAGGLLEHAVRDKAARRPAVVPIEHRLAEDMKPPRGSRLRNRPLEVEVRIGVVVGVDDRDVLDPHPEVARRVVLVERGRRLDVGELHLVWRTPEPEDLRVVADIKRPRLHVVAGEEEKSLALRPELALVLPPEDAFDGLGDLLHVVVRREYAHVRPQIWLWHGAACRERHRRKCRK